MSKIEFLSLASIARKIKSRKLSTVQVAEAFVHNIEKHSNLNAMIYFNKKQVLDDAVRFDKEVSTGQIRGRLHGAPIVIKDNIHVKSMPNTAGCPGFKDFIPKKDAPVVGKLRKEGALFLGKTNMHELAFGVTSNNAYYGRVGNAHNAEYSAGGSSGGTGSAVASRQAPAGLGSDTAGSVRIPSSMNGIFGFRPTMHRYSQEGVTPLSHTRDTIGTMANCIQDLILFDEVITGQKYRSNKINLNRLNIGIPKKYLCSELDIDVQEAFQNAMVDLARFRINLVEIDMDDIQNLDNQLGIIIILYETRHDLIRYLNDYRTGLNLDELIRSIQSPDVLTYFKKFISDDAPGLIQFNDYKKCLEDLRPNLITRYKLLFETYQLDGIIYPAIPCCSVKFTDINEPQTDKKLSRNQNLSSNLGIPSLCIPMKVSSSFGMPIGLQIDSLWNSDHFILKLGHLFNKIYNINLTLKNKITNWVFNLFN